MTTTPDILFSWVGHADLLALAAAEPSTRSAVEKATGKKVTTTTKGTGPLHAMTTWKEFRQIYLIGDYPKPLLKKFAKWVGPQAAATAVAVDDPTKYATVYEAADSHLQCVHEDQAGEAYHLWLGLTSGTPAMAATLVLLGKTRHPARFIQSHASKANEADIPFDLTMEFLPELLREPDAALQALAEHGPAETPGFEAIIGNSRAIKASVGRAKRVAIRDIPVLILGESGTGKELFAHAIHSASRRREKPFVAINCAAIPAELQESELFGHKKGAFTGASNDREGAFQQASGGTLFLDEFGELSLRTQAALLRALQPHHDDPPSLRRFRRVGATREEQADVRIVAATNRNLIDQIASGELREDLYYRVATVTLKLPPLRDRKTDTLTLAQALLDKLNHQFADQEPGYKHKILSGSAKSFVSKYPWPGNVRQLNNALVQAAVMTDSQQIGVRAIEDAVAESPSAQSSENINDVTLGDGFDLKTHLDDIQKRILLQARVESGGTKTHAAELLGLAGYQTLDGMLKRLGIKWKPRL